MHTERQGAIVKLKLRYVVLILIVAFLVPIAACMSLALRYESLDDDAESISLVPDWPDVTYCVMDGVPLKLDLYIPKDVTVGPHPTLVYVHGGGWTGGDKRRAAASLIFQAWSSAATLSPP